jgi:cleavage and polyadenylation specificity factor subunit 2
VTGRVSGHAGAVPALEPVVAGTIQKAMPGNILPARRNVLGARTPIALPHSTMIGDLKLTVLKGRLATIGIHADFVGEGVLICGRKGPSVNTLEQSVAVKKTGRGQVEMEGTVSEVYYIVRREVYKLHALVSQN